MKFIDAPTPDFGIYVARPDTRWAAREAGEPLASLYERGFLPYSGTAGLKNVFYDARSARIVLEEFGLTSENRRIAKKFDGRFVCERVPLTQFAADAVFYDFCLAYFSAKHGPQAMPRARLETIMTSGLVTDILIYRDEAQPVAYVLEVSDGAMGHYWFSFYDLAYAAQSLGLWLMLDALRQARARGLEHYYLGTVYGPKALYKTNFEPTQWWDGSQWSRDVARLKEQSRRD
jgi:hypothetical protein